MVRNFFFLVAAIFTGVAIADQTCESFADLDKTIVFKGDYCVVKTDGSTNKDVLYYFHGKGHNERTWFENEKHFPAQIRRYWVDNKKNPPTVVSFSIENSFRHPLKKDPIVSKFWLLASDDKKYKINTVEYVEKTLIPAIEKKIGKPEGRRIAIGESMGSFNLSQLVFKTALFEKAAILCPPMVSGSPYKPEEIEAYLKATGADASLVSQISLLTMQFVKEEGWLKESPLAVSEKTIPSAKIYASCGDKDPFGFFPGTEKFVANLKANKVDVEWKPVKDGLHCAVDTASVSEYLLK